MRDALARFLIAARWPLLIIYALAAAVGAVQLLRDARDPIILIEVYGIPLANLALFLLGARPQPLGFWRRFSTAIAAANAFTFACWGLCIAWDDTSISSHKDWRWAVGFLVCIWLIAVAGVQALCRPDGLRGAKRFVLLQLAACPLQIALICAMRPFVPDAGWLTGFGLVIGGIMVIVAFIWTLAAGIGLLFAYAKLLSKPAGLCTTCGYDLRGLPEPRCPECGTPFEPECAKPPQPEPTER